MLCFSPNLQQRISVRLDRRMAMFSALGRAIQFLLMTLLHHIQNLARFGCLGVGNVSPVTILDLLLGGPQILPPTGSRCDHAHFRYDVANDFLFEVDFASNPRSWKVEIFSKHAARLPAHWTRTSGLSWQRFRSYGGWNFREKNFHDKLVTAFLTTWGYNFLRP